MSREHPLVSKKEWFILIVFFSFIAFVALSTMQWSGERSAKRNTIEGRLDSITFTKWEQLILHFEDGRIVKLRHKDDVSHIPLRTDVIITYDGHSYFLTATIAADEEEDLPTPETKPEVEP